MKILFPEEWVFALSRALEDKALLTLLTLAISKSPII